jgi:hypothetical protein
MNEAVFILLFLVNSISMRLKSLLVLSVLCLFAQAISAQYYDTGEDPVSLKWQQIKTSRFTVIYPEKYGSSGKAFAQSLDSAYTKLLSFYPDKKFRIPVVIHNYTTYSNGYVAWAPRRIEIYPTPEQNSVPLTANDQLSIHELTHVLQMESLRSGIGRTMPVFFGEQYTGLMAALVPTWFLEGNAVFTETALSQSGRGRTPAWEKQIKAIVLEKGKTYSYDKSFLGSYRDYVPNYYLTGYLMVTWAMTKHDPKIWNKMLRYTSSYPFTINPVNISLYKNAHLTKRKLLKETFDSLSLIWKIENENEGPEEYESLNPDKKKSYINYYSPILAGRDSIIAIKSSLSNPNEFVLIKTDDGKEKRLHIPGKMLALRLSYARGKIVWVEEDYDPRWENRNYSVIKMKELNSNKVTRISRKTRYMSAAISPDGKKIVAVENTIDNKNNLVIIDAQSENIIKSLAAPDNGSLDNPRWSEDGAKITVISLTVDGESVLSFDNEQNKWSILVSARRNDIQSTFLRNDSLFYVSSLSGTDNIYLKTHDNKTIRLTKSKFGVIDPYIKGNTLIFSDYSIFGNNIAVSSINHIHIPVPSSDISPKYLIDRVKFDSDTKTPEVENNYTPTPYWKWQHLFRFHSWMPFYADIEGLKDDPTIIRPGFTIFSQNTLSTLISSVGYEYTANKQHMLHTKFTWKGWYPVVESQFDYGNDVLVDKDGLSVPDPLNIQKAYNISTTVYVPLFFSSGRFSESMRLSLKSENSNRYIYLQDKGTYDVSQTIFTGRYYFSNYRQLSHRDIYPAWAQTIDFYYTFAPFDKNIFGNEVSFLSAFYLPGLFPNNSIRIRYEAEKQSSVKFLYGNIISLPRGYKNMISKDIRMISVDYFLPLAYPDINIPGFLFIKRIRTGLFYDSAVGNKNYIYKKEPDKWVVHNKRENFNSGGFELLADFNFLSVPYTISSGVRSTWKKGYDRPILEMIFNINLYGMTIGNNGN